MEDLFIETEFPRPSAKHSVKVRLRLRLPLALNPLDSRLLARDLRVRLQRKHFRKSSNLLRLSCFRPCPCVRTSHGAPSFGRFAGGERTGKGCGDNNLQPSGLIL